MGSRKRKLGAKKKKRVASKKAIAVLEWRARALKLHVNGWGFAAIARLLGKSAETIRDGIHAELSSITSGFANDIKQRREIKSAQLEKIVKGNLPKAVKGEANASFVCIAAIDKQVKLHGLAAAEKVDVNAKLTLTFDAHQELLDRIAKYVEPAAVHDSAVGGNVADSSGRTDPEPGPT